VNSAVEVFYFGDAPGKFLNPGCPSGERVQICPADRPDVLCAWCGGARDDAPSGKILVLVDQFFPSLEAAVPDADKFMLPPEGTTWPQILGDVPGYRVIDSTGTGRNEITFEPMPPKKNGATVSSIFPAAKTEKTEMPNDTKSATSIDCAVLLADVHAFIGRFVSYPSEHARLAHALWIFHTHLMDAWESTPRIAFLSPEVGSGKTRSLEVTETLVPRPVEAINATPAYLFRKVNDPNGTPTILYDEIDTLFGPKAKDNEEVRGILNAGHRRGAMAGRCVVKGKEILTEELPAYCAVALAGLGNLPDSILSRSVVVRMRRRAPTEYVEPYRRRIHGSAGNALRDRIAAWAKSVKNTICTTPTMPAGIEDRDADVWEALLAVAEAVGAHWQERARVAAVALVAAAKAGTPSLGVRLLADLRQIFGERDAMSTEDIIKCLCEIEEAPWPDLKGKAIDARHLANYLGRYGVQSHKVRIGERSVRGYRREDLFDTWARYLTPATSVTTCAKCLGEGCAWCVSSQPTHEGLTP
jgi:hypothetical protein